MKKKIVFLLALLASTGCSSITPVVGTEDARSAFSAYIIDFWIHRDSTAIERSMSPDMVYHLNGQIRKGDYASHRRSLRGFGGAFPDLAATIDVFTFDGTYGAAVTSWTGTHMGSLRGRPVTGMRELTPTGQKVSWPVIYVFRMDKNRIAELWEVWDEGNFCFQLVSAIPK